MCQDILSVGAGGEGKRCPSLSVVDRVHPEVEKDGQSMNLPTKAAIHLSHVPRGATCAPSASL